MVGVVEVGVVGVVVVLRTDVYRTKVSANMHARNWWKLNLPQSKFDFSRIFVKISSELNLSEVMALSLGSLRISYKHNYNSTNKLGAI